MNNRKYFVIGGVVMVVAIIGGIVWMNVLMRQTRKYNDRKVTKSPQVFEPAEILEEEVDVV